MKEQPNLSYIQEIAGGNKEFEKKFIDILQLEFPKEKSSYDEFVSQEEYEEAAKVVHKIKHKLGILSMKEGYQMAIDYEDELKSGNLELKEAFDRVLEAANDFVTKIEVHEGDHC